MLHAVGVGRAHFVSPYSIASVTHITVFWGGDRELQSPLSQLYISSLDFTTSGSC